MSPTPSSNSSSRSTSGENPQRPVALITGAGSGIGRAIAIRFLNEGWDVVAVGRRKEALETLANLHPNHVVIAPTDLKDPRQVDRLVHQLSENPMGVGQRLKVVVNNAGIFERQSFMKTGDSTWLELFETNLFSAVRLTRAFMPNLEKNKGAVINVSSTLGLRPTAETTAYAASKAAMVNWTQGLAIEAAKIGVRVNCVCPGIVDTPIHDFHEKSPEEKQKLYGSLQPLGRIGRPEEVAHAVWSLAGPGSEWTTGAVLSVDGGIHLV